MKQQFSLSPDKTFIVAEMSANHGQNFDLAASIIKAAHDAGADAIKIQTFTADSMTLDSDAPSFRVEGTIWGGRTLHDIYKEAAMPWEWQPRLKKIADELGMLFFSTPFDSDAVDFLEEMDVPCHKIASFENIDLPLIRKVASTHKPTIISTGMASEQEIQEAVTAFNGAGGRELALLKCTSAYPAPYDEINLKTIPYLAERFGCVVGLSDHTLGIEVPIAAVALGARVIEKHFVLDRNSETLDGDFSLTPSEFKQMVDSVRRVEKALGDVCFSLTPKQTQTVRYRRSIFVVEDIKKGEPFTPINIRSIRPGDGMHPRHYEEIIGSTATQDLQKGTPLQPVHVSFMTES